MKFSETGMEVVESQEILREKLLALPFFRKKEGELVPFEIDNVDYLKLATGQITPEELQEKYGERKRLITADEYLARLRVGIEQGITVEGKDGQGLKLSRDLMSKLEILDPVAQEAYLRGYGEFHSSPDILDFFRRYIDNRGGEILPSHVKELLEGEIERALEDPAVMTGTLESILKMVREFEQKRHSDVLKDVRIGIGEDENKTKLFRDMLGERKKEEV